MKNETSGFFSTRGQSPAVSFSQAVETGLAPDGGLYLPEELPNLSAHFSQWKTLPYPELCIQFLRYFVDFSDQELADIVHRSYAHFSHPDTAPVVNLSHSIKILELFHGPTLAFKDFALQLLGNLYQAQIERTRRPINVLGATSGDTGAAAIHGLLGKKGVKIFILYPEGGVSPLQERQMTCLDAENVYPIAIKGPFDQGQKWVKQAFADQGFCREVGLSAVNSINLARILAQSIYYIYGYLKVNPEKQPLDFLVPTGNFGNVLAGWLAQQMGLPVRKFVVCTNQNDILHRLFSTGEYQVDTVKASVAPSMDIQIASNFERFLYYLEKKDHAKVRSVMEVFQKTGNYQFSNLKTPSFRSSRCADSEIKNIIGEIYQKYHYLLDPHTACAFKALQDDAIQLVLATAHPAKFPAVVQGATGIEPTAKSLEILKQKTPQKYYLDGNDVEAVKQFIRSVQ